MCKDQGLELISSEDLIQELFSRKTLVMVMIYSPEAHKFDHQNHDEYKIMTTVNHPGTINLLEVSLDIVKQCAEGGTHD